MPIVSGASSFVFTPVTITVVSGLFVKGFGLIFDAADEIEADIQSLSVDLDWINTCIDSNVVMDFDRLK